MGGPSRERALRSAASALKGAAKKIKADLSAPNEPLPLGDDAASLPMFLKAKTLPEPQERWTALSTVFPEPTSITPADEAVRARASALIATAEAQGPESLPPLEASFHLGSDWGGEVFGTRDREALAAYAAMGFSHVPIRVATSHHFIDMRLTIPFPSPSVVQRNAVSAWVVNAWRERTNRQGVKSRAEREAETLWRIHDCLRDYLLEGELVRDDARKQFIATIKHDSLFPWLVDERMDVFETAFRAAHPHQARHGTVPTVPEGSRKVRRETLPPSISSDD